MIFADINPYVRYARNAQILPFRNHIIYCAYDNRIFICTGGQGSIKINGVLYKMKPGALLMWKGGEKYEYNTDDFMTLSGCNFDFTCNHVYADSAILPEEGSSALARPLVENVCFEDMPSFNQTVYMEDAADLIPIMNIIINEFEAKWLYYEKKCGGLLSQLLSQVARELNIDRNQKSRQVISGVIEYIKEHYSEKITNAEISNKFSYHPNYINRLMIRCTGLSLHNYLITYRISMAINLLKTSNMSVTEVAEKVGFCDVMHFSKYFKKMTGKTPSSYKLKTNHGK